MSLVTSIKSLFWNPGSPLPHVGGPARPLKRHFLQTAIDADDLLQLLKQLRPGESSSQSQALVRLGFFFYQEKNRIKKKTCVSLKWGTHDWSWIKHFFSLIFFGYSYGAISHSPCWLLFFLVKILQMKPNTPKRFLAWSFFLGLFNFPGLIRNLFFDLLFSMFVNGFSDVALCCCVDVFWMNKNFHVPVLSYYKSLHHPQFLLRTVNSSLGPIPPA